MTGIKVSFMHPQKDVNCLFMEDNLNLLWFIIDQSSLLDRMYIVQNWLKILWSISSHTKIFFSFHTV